MDSTPTKSSPPTTTIQFPVNLHSSHDHLDHHHSPLHPLSSDDNKRAVVGETMDFFADNKMHVDVVKPTKDQTDDLEDENSRGLELIVNTGLNLLTTNTSTDQSMVDDGMSSNMEDKNAKSQLTVLRADLERIKMENLRLRDMANQVTSNYNTLQMHLVALTQGQKTSETNEEHGQEKNHSGNGVVPRQFVDLGLAATGANVDELSLSSSVRRSNDRSRFPRNNAENGNNNQELKILDEDNKGLDRGIDQREDSPDQGSQGWGPYKITRFNSSKSIDQTEATIRKARVSIRARSEAPLVL